MATDVPRVHFEIQRETASSGFDGKSCWVHARAGVIPASERADSSRPLAVMTTQKLLLSGSDVFYALHQLNSEDTGQSWTDPQPIHSFARQIYAPGPEQKVTGASIAPELLQVDDETTVCDFVPQWHARSKRLLGIGHTVWYRNNRVMHVRPRGIAYAVYDHTTGHGRWSPWRCVTLPDEPKFQCAGSGSQQRVDLPNGDVLIPVYLKEPRTKQYASTVVRCRFDGTTLDYVEHGNELTINVKRGLYEPSVTQFGDEFFLTLRNDDHGYVARSSDGLTYSKPQKWTFDDGQELGNYNTQQHWVTHSDGLFLVYTRRGANNDHVFRHRAPLFIGQVDPETLQVIRDTEQILVEERGARLGNFGITEYSPNETWVTVTEWMQPATAADYGSDNTIWVVRLQWEQPNANAQ